MTRGVPRVAIASPASSGKPDDEAGITPPEAADKKRALS
jgi:hypothetical protein